MAPTSHLTILGSALHVDPILPPLFALQPGLGAGIIMSDQGCQTTISVISLSLLLSPLWITLIKRLTHPALWKRVLQSPPGRSY